MSETISDNKTICESLIAALSTIRENFPEALGSLEIKDAKDSNFHYFRTRDYIGCAELPRYNRPDVPDHLIRIDLNGLVYAEQARLLALAALFDDVGIKTEIIPVRVVGGFGPINRDMLHIDLGDTELLVKLAALKELKPEILQRGKKVYENSLKAIRDDYVKRQLESYNLLGQVGESIGELCRRVAIEKGPETAEHLLSAFELSVSSGVNAARQKLIDRGSSSAVQTARAPC